MKKFLLAVLLVFMLIPEVLTAADFWIINPRGGIAFPLEPLANNVNLSWNAGLSARKGFDREMSAGGGLTYVTMPYKVTDAAQPFSAFIINGEFVFAPYLPDFFVWPYIKAGVGLFLVKYTAGGEPPDYASVGKEETAFGIILGGGVNYPLTNEVAANLEILYNQASIQGGQGDNYNFFTFNVGVTLFLK
jgi:hypothetical protein